MAHHETTPGWQPAVRLIKENPLMFRGFATVNFFADDLTAASNWYRQLFDTDPYFAFPSAPAAPAYVEFRVGDDEDELGFIDRRYAPAGAGNAPGGAILYCTSMTSTQPSTSSSRWVPASTNKSPSAGTQTSRPRPFVDPFGNVLGLMHNPHFIEILNQRTATQ
jgi:hypothetical protein